MKAAHFIVRDGDTKAEALHHLDNLSVDGKQWDVTIERHTRKRTPSQNRLYWAWVGEVADAVSEYTGYEKDEVHEYLKARFLTPKVVEIDGVAAEYRSTTRLDTRAMAEYTDRIYRWATGELGIRLPLPPVATEQRS